MGKKTPVCEEGAHSIILATGCGKRAHQEVVRSEKGLKVEFQKMNEMERQWTSQKGFGPGQHRVLASRGFGHRLGHCGLCEKMSGDLKEGKVRQTK